jgi:hypothetical protein
MDGGELRLSARATLRAGLVRAMGVLIAVAVVGSLALHGETRALVVDGLGMLVVWMSAAVCWLGVLRVGIRQREVLLAAIAATSFAGGLTYYAVVLAKGETFPFPSPRDVASLSFYPLMLAAVAVAVRRRSRGLVSSVWLDGAVGSLGAAAVLAVLLSPVLDAALTGPPSLTTAVAIAYPVFDLVLIAAVAGIIALGGTPGRPVGPAGDRTGTFRHGGRGLRAATDRGQLRGRNTAGRGVGDRVGPGGDVGRRRGAARQLPGS